MKLRTINSKFVLCFTLTVLLKEIPVVNGIKCFTCTNTFDRYPNGPPCGDNFRLLSVDAVECPSGSCMKTRGARWSGSTRRVEINRYCGEQIKDGCNQGTYDDISVNSCACGTDFCNSAVSRKISVSMTICFICVIYFIFR